MLVLLQCLGLLGELGYSVFGLIANIEIDVAKNSNKKKIKKN
jgi:hypothetical protein